MYIDGEFTETSFWASDLYDGSAHFWLLMEDYYWVTESNAQRQFFSTPTLNIFNQDRIDIDLIVTGVTQQFVELDKLEPHIGNTFSHFFYGQSPCVLNVNGYLMNSSGSIGKLELMELYRWVFRISRVAKTGVAPFLSFVGCTVQGGMLNLELTDSGDLQDVLQVQFQFLAFLTRFLNTDNYGVTSASIDFSTHNDEMVA